MTRGDSEAVESPTSHGSRLVKHLPDPQAAMRHVWSLASAESRDSSWLSTCGYQPVASQA